MEKHVNFTSFREPYFVELVDIAARRFLRKVALQFGNIVFIKSKFVYTSIT
jgi:hypothetical protein